MKRTIAGTLVFLFTTSPLPAVKTPIEVRVEVTEIDRNKASSVGAEWLDSIELSERSVPGLVSIGGADRVTALHADVHFLVQEGAAEILANPNLITDSGTTATFHAGGEIPYVTSATLGTTHVEFKPYGVMLEVRPKLLPDGLIQMKIRAGVSAPDVTNGVVLSGTTVPALSEREVTSNVTLSPGATITLAGLVQTHNSTVERGVPFLRRIPFLGALFRWRKKNFWRTTIVIFVTPRLIDI